MSNLHTFFVVGGIIIFIILFFLLLAGLDKLWMRRVAQRQELIFRTEPRVLLSAMLSAALLLFIHIPLLACYYYFEVDKIVPDWVMLLSLSVSAVVICVLALAFFLKILSKGRVEIDANRFSWRIGREKGEISFSRPFKIDFGRTIRIVTYATSEGGGSSLELPTAVCDIEQDGKTYSFYYDAPANEIASFPETELRGAYLFQGGKLIMDRIKERR